MTTTPHAALLSDDEIAQCINLACTNLFDRSGTTSFKIARSIEQAILAKLQATQEPVQAGELPEPDAVFYCSEDTGYLTQYRRPPANLTDGDVAMYEADTVRSLLISAALAERKPLTVLTLQEVDQLIASKHFDPKYIRKDSDEVVLSWYRLGVSQGVAEFCRINSLEVKP